MSFQDDTHRRDNYAPIKVHNIAALLERLGADCLPEQACREFTQNAIQSIEQRQKDDPELSEGLVLWTKHLWKSNNGETTTPKLCIIDTGEGMTGEQMKMYINQLMISGSGRGPSNFGIGAKITGLIRSPYGVVYASYKEGKGEVVMLARMKDGNYGLHRTPKGTEIFPAEKVGFPMPHEIKTIGRGTGTMVIFVGTSTTHNTLNLFGDNATSVIRYLNDRYLKFPKNIILRSKIHDDTEGRIHGTQFMLDQAYIAKGNVIMPNTKAIGHWWVLGDPKGETPYPFTDGEGSFKQMKSFSKYYRLTGHTAYMFENELYEYQFGNASTTRIQRCGIPLNTHRVVIYFEPTDSHVCSNSSRRHLQIKQDEGTGTPLVWEDYAEEFRQRMPAELRDAMAKFDVGPDYKTRDEAVSKRLREVIGLFTSLGKVIHAAYKDAAGKNIVDPDKKIGEIGFSNTGRRGPRNKEPQEHVPGPGLPRPDRDSDFTRDLFGLSEDEDGEPGFPVDVSEIKEPEVRWVSNIEKFKQPTDLERNGDQLIDRAASYDPTANMLIVNRDFTVYQAWIEMYAQQWPSTAQARDVIRTVLDSWWLLALKECVMLNAINRGLLSWEKNPSEDTLTTAVLSRYNMRINLMREIHYKLGKPERTLDEAAVMDRAIDREKEEVKATATVDEASV